MGCQIAGMRLNSCFRSPFRTVTDSSRIPVSPDKQPKFSNKERTSQLRKWPHRLCFILVIAGLFVVATGCQNVASTGVTQTSTQETAAPTSSEELSVSIEEQVLLDQQGVKITALSLYKNSERPMLSILIENSGKNDIAVELWHGQINDKSLDLNNNNLNCIVSAGKKTSAEIELYIFDVITIRDIELGFRIQDRVAKTDTNSDVVTIATKTVESTTPVDDMDNTIELNKNRVLYKKDGITVSLGAFQEPSVASDTPALEVCIANDSDHEVNAYFRNFFVNGQAIESAWLQFHRIHAGNSGSEWILFYSDELALLGITAFEMIDFQLEVWSPDGSSETIQIYDVSLTIPDSVGSDSGFIYPEISAEIENIEAESKLFTDSIVEQVLGDQNGIKLTAVSLDTTNKDPHELTRLEILLENNTGEQLSGRMSYAVINGVMVDAYFSLDQVFIRMNSGDQHFCYIDISNESLVDAGIQTIKDIEFGIELRPAYSGEVQNSYSVFAQVSTRVPKSFVQVLDSSGTVIMDRDGVKVVVQGLHRDYYQDMSFVKIYVENNSDHIVGFDLLDVFLNFEEIDPPYFDMGVYPGKVAYGRIEFPMDELDHGESLMFRLLTRDVESGATIFETDAISLTFSN